MNDKELAEIRERVESYLGIISNPTLIMLLREDVPKLLDEVERLQKDGLWSELHETKKLNRILDFEKGGYKSKWMRACEKAGEWKAKAGRLEKENEQIKKQLNEVAHLYTEEMDE